MSKFKAGDRVLAIRSGAIGLVKETSPNVTSVDVSGVLTWFNTDDLVAATAVSAGTNFTLTRRDHFAMAALTGVMGSGDITIELLFEDEESRRRVSVWSYELADAMEAARNKEGEA